jgi:PAS domain S-box-containing protein
MGNDKEKSRGIEAADLRREAEKRLRTQMSELYPTRAEEETHRLVQELQVHQIELEMQNDELCKAREELEAALDTYADLYDFAPVGYVTLDRDGVVRAVNLTGANFLGAERSRLIGRLFRSFVAEEHRADFTAFLGRVFSGETEEACVVALLKEGSHQLFVQIEARADAGGQGCRVALIDITGRRQAEDALRESRERMYKLAQLAVDAIIMLDDSGAVTFCNSATEKMFGFPSEEIIGKDFHRHFIPERLRDAAEHGFAGFRERGAGPIIGATTEMTGLRKEGTEFPLELSVSTIQLKEKWHAIGIMRDISERKSLESQLLQAQKMEAVGLLAGGIAHDFNNILTVIGGYGYLSETKMQENDPLRCHLREILAAAERGVNLTKSLLIFSRKHLVNPRPANVNEIIRNVDTFLTMVIGEDVLLAKTPAEKELMVTADSGQIEQVLINLATNARRAMPHGGTLSIACEAFTINPEFIKARGFGKPGDYALISVTDTGTGMDRETVRRIFEPFFTTRTMGKGTGLGLSIVYSLVKQHNGYIDVASEPGKGTTFRIYLPLTRDDPTPEEQTHLPSAQRGTETILLAEDDAAVRSLTEQTLTGLGYRVISAVDGEDAVQKYSANKDSVQMLLFDVIMPNRNGKEAYDEIVKISPGVRILFMSGYTADILEANDFTGGAEVLAKPFSSNDLAIKVRTILDEERSVCP